MNIWRIDTNTIDLSYLNQPLYGFKGFDVHPPNHWIAVAGRSAECLRLYSDHGVIDIPQACRFPITRYIDNNTVLVASARIARQDEINTWIIDLSSGHRQAEFSIGDAVKDILVMDNHLVVSYFDEGIFGDIKPSDEGFSIFDKSGNFLYGYNNHSSNSVFISDCYAISKKNEEEFILFPYADFPIVNFNLANKQQIIFEIPEVLHGSCVISYIDDAFLFCSPYIDRNGIYSFEVDSSFFQKIGSQPAFYSRGLPDGRILGWQENSISIMTISRQSDSA